MLNKYNNTTHTTKLQNKQQKLRKICKTQHADTKTY